jgi:dienelactone hydrolase
MSSTCGRSPGSSPERKAGARAVGAAGNLNIPGRALAAWWCAWLIAACASRAPAPGTAAGEPLLEVAPRTALVDQPLTIRMAGLPPGGRVTLRATMARTPEVAWQSSAVFVADRQGAIDLGRDAPVEGSYQGADAMGLVWSMTPTSDAWLETLGQDSQLDPQQIRFEAEHEGKVIAGAEVQRLKMAADVTRHELRADGLVGALFLPPRAAGARAAGVLVLGGSEGGMREDTAALLASHGYAALALAYFAAPELPPTLEKIPLEYFEKALKWMASHEAIDGERLAVQGISRGGELALLLAATYPDHVDAVVAHVPSGVVWPGVGGFPPGPAWTRNGEGVPTVSLPVDPAIQGEMLRKMRAGEPIELTPLFRAAMKNSEAMAAAEIPVERIRGPVLLISARTDALWPSTDLSEIAVARLRAHGHPHPVEHLAYDDAGHLLLPPYRVTSIAAMPHPVLRMKLTFGGTPAGTARAMAESWQRVLAFLATSLRL